MDPGITLPKAIVGSVVAIVWMASPGTSHAADSVVANIEPAASTFTKIEPPDPGFALDLRFGASVALQGDDLYIGASGDGAESLHHYHFDGTSWSEAQVIEGNHDGFGRSMALSAGRLAVGMDGQVAVYDVSGENPQFSFMVVDDAVGFGATVALSGDVLVVLSSEGAHVFAWSTTDWELQTVLSPATEGGLARVAIDDNLIALSNPIDGSGFVWVYAHDGNTWVAEQTLEPAENGDIDFGLGVDLDAETLAVARHGTEVVQIFDRMAGQWTLREGFRPPTAGNYYGGSLWLEGDLILVGDGGTFATTGVSELWRRETDGEWISQARLGAAHSIFKDGMRLALGYPTAENDNGTKVGHVTIVDLTGGWTGSDCSVPDDCIGNVCVDGKCCNASCNHTCDVCSVEAGATRDGVCTDIQGPQCCQYDEDCGEGTSCLFLVCDKETNTCGQEDLCCVDDSDCEADPGSSCGAICVAGRCENDCGSEGSTSAASGDPGSAGPGPVSIGPGAGQDDDGCGCSQHRDPKNGHMLFAMLLLAGIRRPCRAHGAERRGRAAVSASFQKS